MLTFSRLQQNGHRFLVGLFRQCGRRWVDGHPNLHLIHGGTFHTGIGEDAGWCGVHRNSRLSADSL